MGFFSKFEGKMEDAFEGAAGKMQNSPIQPSQIMKKAEKQMRREKMVGSGCQYAPTLYTVLVSPEDDQRLFGFYPTLAGETETRLESSAAADGLTMECHPLVRFIADDTQRSGKFDVIAEVVSAPIIAQLRTEEMQRYGLAASNNSYASQDAYSASPKQGYSAVASQAAGPRASEAYDANDPFAPKTPEQYAAQIQQDNQAFDVAPNQPEAIAYNQEESTFEPKKPPLPYVPEDEIDYSINYGEYTFDSRNFEDYRTQEPADEQETQVPVTPADQARAEAEARLLAQAQAQADAILAAEQAQQQAYEIPAAYQPQQTYEPAAPAAQPAVRSYGAHGRHAAYVDFDEEEEARPAAVARHAQQPAAQAPYQPAQQAAAAYPQVQPASVYQPVQQAYEPVQPAAAVVEQPVSQAAGQSVSSIRPQSQPLKRETVNPLYAGGIPATVNFNQQPQAQPAGRVAPQASIVRAHLIDITANRSYDLATNVVTVGRELTNNIVVNDLNVSRNHAQISFESQGIWVITDLNSTNGTYVNGVAVSRRGLRDGDRITMGVSDFIFSMR